MGAYSTRHQTAAGTDLPIINLTGSATVRASIFELILGSDASPADQAGEFVLNRTTDVGTGGTALPEIPLDPLTAAATCAAIGGTFGTPPVDTASTELLMIALNQRATFRWVAAADRYRIVSIAAANNGLMLNCTAHSATPNMNATIMWDE